MSNQSAVLVYQGRYPKVSVDGVSFIRDKETVLPAELRDRIMKGEDTLPANSRRDFVVPSAGKPEVAEAVKEKPKKTG